MLLDLTPLPGFLLASAVVVLTPGVDVFLLLRTSLRQGIRPGLLALAGIHSASIIQVTLVISGLGALITHSLAVLSVLKWLGAAYLVYLAVTILRGLWLARREATVGGMVLAYMAGLHYWWPKITGRMYSDWWSKLAAIITFVGFFLTFLPQFVGTAAQPALQLIMLGVVFLGIAAIWELTIVLAAARIADRLRQPRVAQSLDMVSAAAFLTISAALLAG